VSVRGAEEQLGGGEVRLGGSRLLVRRADAGDRTALEAMFQRCSLATVYRRFHGQVRAFPRAYLDEALAGGDMHYAVVCYSGCEAVALASYRTGEPGAAELGILIEDAWQRRGLGGLLLGRLVAYAADHGIGVLHAQMLTEQDWITGMLARHGSWTSAFGRGVREVTLHLGRGGSAAPEGFGGDAVDGASAARALPLGGRGTR